MFRTYYGELFFIGWMLAYPLAIIYTQKFDKTIATQNQTQNNRQRKDHKSGYELRKRNLKHPNGFLSPVLLFLKCLGKSPSYVQRSLNTSLNGIYPLRPYLLCRNTCFKSMTAKKTIENNYRTVILEVY